MSIPLIPKEDVAETISVIRTQRIHIPYDENISYFCHLSKNLWNQAHYFVLSTKEYKESKMIPTYGYMDGVLNKKSYYKDPEFDNYHKLGATAQQILRLYDKSWKSYKNGNYGYYDESNPKKDNYTGKPKEPKFKKKYPQLKLSWRVYSDIYKRTM